MTLPSFLEQYFNPEEIIRLQKKKAFHTEHVKELLLVRLTQDLRNYPRGSIFYENGFIPGYPKIVRVLHLQNGINRYFKGRFYVEEKMDGYNVRIALIDGNPLAFTRGGFICPFTTNRIPDLVDMNFFRTYPRYIINGEVVGPGSPYNTEVIPYIDEDVVLFVFDLLNEIGKSLSVEERYAILEPFTIQQVRRWGPFSPSDIENIRAIILELEREEREGVVIKPISDGKPVKYVTLSSCLRDFQATASLMTEIPAGFYIQRILRAVFFCHEFGVSLDEHYLLESARALYLLPKKALKEIAEGGNIRESFLIKAKSKDALDDLLHHLHRSGISTKLLSLEKNGDYYRVKFHRIYTKGTREIRRRLMGHGFFD